MACEYCKNQKKFETKPKFKYHTAIVGDSLVVSKMAWRQAFRIFNFIKYPKALYCNTINYCPMCGEKLERKEEDSLEWLEKNDPEKFNEIVRFLKKAKYNPYKYY